AHAARAQEMAVPAVDDSPSAQLLLEQAADQAKANPREATEVKVFLELRNPNDAPVELTTWDYTFTVGDRTAYSGPWVASLTLPPKQVMVTEVPAVVPASFGDVAAGKWRIGGTVGYRATGKLDRLLYQLGINRLTALFGVSGEGIELTRAAPASPPAEAPKAEPTPATPAP
ncbi:MAG: LEA type 2 family protein, partial [Phycisphaerales bacterium]